MKNGITWYHLFSLPRLQVSLARLGRGLPSNANASSDLHNLLMCGRYRLSRRKQILEEHFAGVSGEEDWSPRYNIAPTQSVPVIRQNPKKPVRELSLVRWGLIPSWTLLATSQFGIRMPGKLFASGTKRHDSRVTLRRRALSTIFCLASME